MTFGAGTTQEPLKQFLARRLSRGSAEGTGGVFGRVAASCGNAQEAFFAHGGEWWAKSVAASSERWRVRVKTRGVGR